MCIHQKHLDSVGVDGRQPGQYYDEETGYHQNWHRDYDPTIGRYLQSDPIGLAAGVSTYGYAGQNPIMYYDPDGLDLLIWKEGGVRKTHTTGNEAYSPDSIFKNADSGTCQIIDKGGKPTDYTCPCDQEAQEAAEAAAKEEQEAKDAETRKAKAEGDKPVTPVPDDPSPEKQQPKDRQLHASDAGANSGKTADELAK